MHVCLVCSHISPPPLPDSDEEDEEGVRLTLKELLAEFNEKVKAGVRVGPQGGRQAERCTICPLPSLGFALQI